MYIEQVFKGLYESWRFILGFVIIFVAWQFIGALPLIGAMVAASLESGSIPSDITEFPAVLGNNLFLFLLLLTFAVGLLSVFLTVKYLHQRSITTLTTARKKIDWKRMSYAFIFWALLSGALIWLDIFLSPEDYEYNFKLAPFLVLFCIAVVMIPMQTSFEEFFIRGYLMQGIGSITTYRWVPLVLTSVLFGLLHIINPEVDKLG